MRLVDLKPHWFVLEERGPRVGMTFECPHCVIAGAAEPARLGVCFHHDGRAAMEDQYILTHHGTSDLAHIWDLMGQDDFRSLTLRPSIDASGAGHAHVLITNGEVA